MVHRELRWGAGWRGGGASPRSESKRAGKWKWLSLIFYIWERLPRKTSFKEEYRAKGEHKRGDGNLHRIYKISWIQLGESLCTSCSGLSRRSLTKRTHTCINKPPRVYSTAADAFMPVRPFCCSSVFFFFRLTHQYSIDLTVCLRAITNHPRNSFQSVRVGPEPGQKWSKTAEESERDTERRLSGPNYIQSLKIGKVQSEREREIFMMRAGGQMSRGGPLTFLTLQRLPFFRDVSLCLGAIGSTRWTDRRTGHRLQRKWKKKDQIKVIQTWQSKN